MNAWFSPLKQNLWFQSPSTQHLAGVLARPEHERSVRGGTSWFSA